MIKHANLCIVVPSIISAARFVGASDTHDLILSASTSVDFCSDNSSSNFSNTSLYFVILRSASSFLVFDNIVFKLSVVVSIF